MRRDKVEYNRIVQVGTTHGTRTRALPRPANFLSPF